MLKKINLIEESERKGIDKNTRQSIKQFYCIV